MPDAQPPSPPKPSQPDTGQSSVAGSPGASGIGSAVPSASIGTGLPSAITPGQRSSFNADELAIVLSHFDVGVIEEIKDFPRGSRKAPKLRLKTDKGLFLLKRRALGKDDPFKVAFCHAVQIHLAERQFPLPHLIGTRTDNNSMLKWKGATYELFEYIRGNPYDYSLEATTDAGKTLSLFHKLLRDFRTDYDAARGTYHRSKSVLNAMQQLPKTLEKAAPDGPADRRQQVCRFLHDAYAEAAKRVEDEGFADWPRLVSHSDWHPGNMLFRGNRVVAVIDYDAARLAQRVLDTANGALQFSIRGGGEQPEEWPDDIDGTRFKRFLRGYDAVPDNVLTKAELRTVPWLMVEALIAESVIPIAATGFFSRMAGGPFLEMVVRKVRWLRQNHREMVAYVE